MQYKDYIKNSIISILTTAGFDNMEIQIQKSDYVRGEILKNKYKVSISVGIEDQNFVIFTDFKGGVEEFTIKNNLTVQATLLYELRKLVMIYLKNNNIE